MTNFNMFSHLHHIYLFLHHYVFSNQACSEEQKTFASEVIETLNTFNQVSVINSNYFSYSFKSQIRQIVEK